GLAEMDQLPGNQDLKNQLHKSLDVAAMAKAAHDLHHIADRFRTMFGIGPRSAKLEVLEGQCRAFWEKRHLIREKLGKELGPEIEHRVDLDLLDLAIQESNLSV